MRKENHEYLSGQASPFFDVSPIARLSELSPLEQIAEISRLQAERMLDLEEELVKVENRGMESLNNLIITSIDLTDPPKK